MEFCEGVLVEFERGSGYGLGNGAFSSEDNRITAVRNDWKENLGLPCSVQNLECIKIGIC